MKEVKEGDLITVKSVRDEYMKKGDISMIKVEVPYLAGDDVLKQLRGKHIFTIEEKEIAPELTALGFKKYGMNSQKVVTLSFEDEDKVLINGSVELPDSAVAKKKDLTDTFFWDEEYVRALVVSFNEVERNKLKVIMPIVEKALQHMDDVVENERV